MLLRLFKVKEQWFLGVMDMHTRSENHQPADFADFWKVNVKRY